MTTERAVKVGVGGDREVEGGGGVWTTFEKGGDRQYRRVFIK